MTLEHGSRAACAALLLTVGACGSERGLVNDLDFFVDPVEVLPCGFSPLSGTRMSIYDCNPVFTATEEPWVENIRSVAFRTEAVLGHPVFQVWYTADMPGYDGWGLGHAVSDDGIAWSPHPNNPLYGPTLGWDAVQASAMTVAYDRSNDAYALLYQGGDIANNSLGVGVLTSPNGVAWRAPDRGSLMLDLVADRTGICWPLGLTWSRRRGFYGFLASTAGSRGFLCEIFAFGAPGLPDQDFVVDNFRTLQAGPRRYDAAGATSVAAVDFGATTYLFYTGFRDWETAEENENFRRTYDSSLALATSRDGIRFDKHGESPFRIHRTEPGVVDLVGAQVIGDRIHLWVRDDYEEEGRRGIGYFLYEPTIEPHP